MAASDQLLAVAAWLRGRYEEAPAAELPLLAAVIAYLEALAEREAAASGPAAPVQDPPASAPTAEGAGHAMAGWETAAVQLGTFRETAWGGTVTPDGQSPVRLPAVVVAAAGLRHGDRVHLAPRPGEPEHYFFTRTGEQAALQPSDVREAVGVLEREGDHLMVAFDGRRARARLASPAGPEPRAGDVVTVRYSPAELAEPHGGAHVVRIHTATPGPLPPAPAPRHAARRPARAVAADQDAADPGPPPEPPAGPLPRILIVGGHDRNHLHFGQGLEGLAVIDWSPGTRLTKALRRRLESAEAVVLVTQHMSHSVSAHVLASLRASGRPYIYAQSANHSGLARQVQEALLPRLLAHGQAAPASEAGP